ncbi:hypothetical protein ACFL1N_15540 [Thermodesulfobacteriota bacterium]
MNKINIIILFTLIVLSTCYCTISNAIDETNPSNNLSGMEILIEYFGSLDRPRYSVLFKYKDEIKDDLEEVYRSESIKSPRKFYMNEGLIMLLNKKEMGAIKKVVVAYSDEAILKFNGKASQKIKTSGFTFTIYQHDKVVLDYMLDIEWSKKILKEVYLLLSSDDEKSSLFKDSMLVIY